MFTNFKSKYGSLCLALKIRTSLLSHETSHRTPVLWHSHIPAIQRSLFAMQSVSCCVGLSPSPHEVVVMTNLAGLLSHSYLLENVVMCRGATLEYCPPTACLLSDYHYSRIPRAYKLRDVKTVRASCSAHAIHQLRSRRIAQSSFQLTLYCYQLQFCWTRPLPPGIPNILLPARV